MAKFKSNKNKLSGVGFEFYSKAIEGKIELDEFLHKILQIINDSSFKEKLLRKEKYDPDTVMNNILIKVLGYNSDSNTIPSLPLSSAVKREILGDKKTYVYDPNVHYKKLINAFEELPKFEENIKRVTDILNKAVYDVINSYKDDEEKKEDAIYLTGAIKVMTLVVSVIHNYTYDFTILMKRLAEHKSA